MKAILKTKVRSTDTISDEVPDHLSARYVRAGLAEYVGEDSDTDDLTPLRAEYKAKMGKQAHHTWDAAKIREKMEE